jgi:hypothetical protein
MTVVRILLVFSLLFIINIKSKAQQNFEWRTDSYAGINSIYLNPSFPAQFPLRWDLNLAGVGLLLDNNYTYLRKASNLDLIRKRANLDIAFGPDLLETGTQPAPDALVVDFFQGTEKRYAMLNQRFEGPSFLFKINEYNTVGFFTGFRSMFSAQNIPGAFSYYTYDPFPLNTPFTVDQMDGTMMSWAEYGLHFSHSRENAVGKVSFGINLKLLQGYEAAYFDVSQPFEYSKLPNDSISGSRAFIDFGLTTSLVNNADNFQPVSNGSGVGFSLGFNFAADAYDGDKPYEYRIGFSLLDIGSIRFSQNAAAHRLETDNLAKVAAEDYQTLNYDEDNINDAIRIFSNQVLGDPDASFADSEFGVFLPSALSLQGDYAFTPNFFLSAALIQRIPFGKIKVRRDNYFNLSPRFEHRWFGAGIPLSFYNWDQFKIGATVRLAYLVIGTENITSWISKAPYTGSDFYIALKVNPFQLGFDGFGKRKKKKRSKVKCYEFN